MAEVSVGLVVVLVAAAFGSAAEAPEALRWLPVPFMVTALLALAFMHLQSVPSEAGRRSVSGSSLVVGATVGGIALLALGAGFLALPSIDVASDGLVAIGEGVLNAIGVVLWPFVQVFSWLFGVFDFGFDQPEQEMPQGEEPVREEEESEPSLLSELLGYVIRGGLLVAGIALALTLIWFAFRRFTRRGDRATDETREEIETETGNRGDLRSLLAGAMGRLRFQRGGRDAIGRLYVSMLRSASQRGLERPPATTPLEFAPRLEAAFGSAAPEEITRAYTEARFGARPPDASEVDRLRSAWNDAVKGRG
jgi:Domain of unknown function (DUF4129)